MSLRAGHSKRPYFAHMPGSSGNDCHLYVEGMAQGLGATTVLPNQYSGPCEVSLGLRLSDSRAQRGWGLELTVPTGGLLGVEVTVDVGGRTQVVRCSSERELLKNVTAEPQTTSYDVVSVTPSHSPLAASLRRNCAALDAERATVFGEVGRPSGQVVPRVCELKVGRTYVFVWPTNANPEFPAQLECERLKRRPDWEAALITLSHPLQPDVQHWLKEFTGLPLSMSAVEIVAVWPPLMRKVTAGLVEAQQKLPVMLHAGCLTATGRSGVNALFARAPMQTLGANTKNINEPFFRLIPDNESVIEVTCQGPSRYQATIDFVLGSDRAPMPAVELVGVDGDGTIKSVGLHDQVSIQWLDEIRHRRASFSYLSLPPHVTGTLNVGRDGIWETQLKLRATAASAHHCKHAKLLAPSACEQLVVALMNPGLDLFLDFGALGRVRSAGWMKREVVKDLSLPGELRGRLLAYLFQTQRYLLPALDARVVTDSKIISTFLHSTPDILATATWRTLKAALESYFGDDALRMMSRVE